MTRVAKNRHWHRLFGITLLDYFSGSNYAVELEKDLSVQKQMLDVVIFKRPRGKPPQPLPDGLEKLSRHNLLTFKSHQEPLDTWALRELIGHYINYRKQTLTKRGKLYSERDFGLYAVCARYPQQLAAQISLQEIQDGVYTATCLDKEIRIIVSRLTALTPNNTLWHLFSGTHDRFDYAKEHHHWRDSQTSTVVNEIYEYYESEGAFMPYTLEDYHKHAKRYLIRKVKENLDEVLAELSPEVLVKRLSTAQRLQGLSPEDIEAYLATVKTSVKSPRKRKSST